MRRLTHSNLWAVAVVLLASAFIACRVWRHGNASEIELSSLSVIDVSEHGASIPEATSAVVLQVRNLGRRELIFATNQVTQPRVNRCWLTPRESLLSPKFLGLRIAPGTSGTLIIAVPPRTEALRLLLQARHPALLERTRWFSPRAACSPQETSGSEHKTVQRTGGSRLAQRRIERHRRLPPVADLCRWAIDL